MIEGDESAQKNQCAHTVFISSQTCANCCLSDPHVQRLGARYFDLWCVKASESAGNLAKIYSENKTK